jgi:hypothetical protein
VSFGLDASYMSVLSFTNETFVLNFFFVGSPIYRTIRNVLMQNNFVMINNCIIMRSKHAAID